MYITIEKRMHHLAGLCIDISVFEGVGDDARPICALPARIPQQLITELRRAIETQGETARLYQVTMGTVNLYLDQSDMRDAISRLYELGFIGVSDGRLSLEVKGAELGAVQQLA